MARRDRHGQQVEDKFVKSVFSLISVIVMHKSVVGFGVAIVAAGLIGFFAYRSHIRAFNEEARVALERATETEEYGNIAEHYEGSNVEPMALFIYANKLLEEEEYDQAMEAFSHFIDKFPGNYLVPYAYTFKGSLLEQAERWEDAAITYRSVIEKFPDAFTVPRAMLNLGACSEQLGKHEEARELYEECIEEYPDTRWKERAESKLAQLEVAQSKAKEEKAGEHESTPAEEEGESSDEKE